MPHYIGTTPVGTLGMAPFDQTDPGSNHVPFEEVINLAPTQGMLCREEYRSRI